MPTTPLSFEQQWLEHDYNPFLVFNAQGKVETLNTEAQYLMGAVDASTIYDIATTHATVSFGFKTTFTNFEFGTFKFFGITVGYIDEEHIGIRLYQTPTFKFVEPESDTGIVNIFTLLDLCISSNTIGSSTKYLKDFDPTIPEIRLEADGFIKMVNKIFSAMKGSEMITTRVYYRIGEYIRLEDKKYRMVAVEVASDLTIDAKSLADVRYFADANHFFVSIRDSKITINLPMITE